MGGGGSAPLSAAAGAACPATPEGMELLPAAPAIGAAEPAEEFAAVVSGTDGPVVAGFPAAPLLPPATPRTEAGSPESGAGCAFGVIGCARLSESPEHAPCESKISVPTATLHELRGIPAPSFAASATSKLAWTVTCDVRCGSAERGVAHEGTSAGSSRRGAVKDTPLASLPAAVSPAIASATTPATTASARP
jgi:hypothetical protein